jgi:hypothetical protein
MVRIGISVEGVTEERFIKRVLIPYFSDKSIYLTPVSLHGNVSVDRVKHELEKLAYSFDFITTFYDFYGFKNKHDGEGKQSLEARITDGLRAKLKERVLPYIQMYEFEGLLFSSPGAIASVLQNQSLESWADSILEQFGNNPERVNDKPETAPSKRLLKSSKYRKTIHGPDIAHRIGLDGLRSMCAGFDQWLSWMEGFET